MPVATLAKASASVLATATLLAAFPAAASAGGSPGGLTSTQCGQSYTPSCTVTAGSPGSSGTPGSAGSPGSLGGGQATGTLTGHASGGSAGCQGKVNGTFGCVPPGCTIKTATLACPLGALRPAGPGGRGPGAPALPAPGVLARLAERLLRLPHPVIRSSPAPGARQLTELPTWLWMAPGVWTLRSATASVPGESVTATATPVSAAWQMGDGHTVTCHGPGTAYTGAGNPASASPTCGYTYTQSSAGRPGAAFHVTVTITWAITWRGGGTAGTLPPLFTTSAALFRVAESQAVNP
jgi:hypothetical protein